MHGIYSCRFISRCVSRCVCICSLLQGGGRVAAISKNFSASFVKSPLATSRASSAAPTFLLASRTLCEYIYPCAAAFFGKKLLTFPNKAQFTALDLARADFLSPPHFPLVNTLCIDTEQRHGTRRGQRTGIMPMPPGGGGGGQLGVRGGGRLGDFFGEHWLFAFALTIMPMNVLVMGCKNAMSNYRKGKYHANRLPPSFLYTRQRSNHHVSCTHLLQKM